MAVSVGMSATRFAVAVGCLSNGTFAAHGGRGFGTGFRRVIGFAETGLDRTQDAFLDDLRWQAVQGALEGISRVNALAVDPGFACLPMDVVPKERLVHLVDVRIVGEHDVAGEVEREAVINERATP